MPRFDKCAVKHCNDHRSSRSELCGYHEREKEISDEKYLFTARIAEAKPDAEGFDILREAILRLMRGEC